MNGSTSRSHRNSVLRNALGTAIAVLTLGTSVFAQGQSDERTEGTPRKYPPLPVHRDALYHPVEQFREITAKIADGTATEQERRQWYHLRRLYYPYTPDALPPKDWRAQAIARGKALTPGRQPSAMALGTLAATGETSASSSDAPVSAFLAPSKYVWSHLGNGSFCAGDPPAAGCPDKGTGRATALWVNPLNKKEILVGFADGGLWRSTDQGTSWTPIFDFMPVMTVGSIAAFVPPGGNLNNATIYVATGEGNFGGGGVEGDGIYRTTDGGATWVKMAIPWHVAGDGTSMAPNNTSVRRIAIDPNNTQKVWIAADSGVYRTVDGGGSWTLVTGLPYWKKFTGDCWGVYWTDLIIDDSTSPSTIYAAGPRPFNSGCSNLARQDNGVYRSQDDGASWVNISTPTTNCPAGRGYICIGTGFAASGVAAGATNGNIGRITLIHSQSNKKQIYALLHNVSNNGSLGIWETTDASAVASVAWTARATTNYCNQQCWYDMSGAVDPANPARVIVGGLDAYVSSANASTINKTSSWTGWGTANYVHADHHHFVWADSSTIYVAADGGLHIGTVPAGALGTNSVTWVTKNGAIPNAIDALQFYGFAQHPTIPYKIHGGLQDNGEVMFVLDGSGNPTNYTQTAGGDGGFSATDQGDGNIAYEEYVYAIISQSTDGGSNYGSCFRSFGSCTTILNRCSGSCVPDNATEFIAPMELDENVNDANGRDIVFSASKYVYRNTTSGSTTWVRYSPDLSYGSTAGDDIVNIHSAKNNGTAGTIWAVTTNGHIARTTGGTTATVPSWTLVSVTCNPTGTNGAWSTTGCARKAPLPNRAANWVTTDPTDGNRAIVVFGGFNTGHVFRTTDGGATWTDISGMLPNEPYYSVAINPDNVNQGFVGSDFGVYVNENIWTSNSWTKISNNILPHARANEMQFSPMAIGGAKRLRVATHGRGIWELTINNCTPPAVPSGLTATASGAGQITLTWTNNGGAGLDHFNVYRAVGSCPTGTYFPSQYVKIGQTVGAATTYVDNSVVPGQTYSYKVIAATSATSPVCESDFSNCASTTAFGNCTVKPNFGGATAATAITGSCGVRVSWDFGNSNCPASPGPLVYNVYRGAAGFTPGPANLVARGVSANFYDDTSVAASTAYQYIVRAEDATSGNGGPARNGNEDLNTVRVNVSTPACTAGPLPLQVLTVTAALAGTNKIEWVGPTSGSGLQLAIRFSTSGCPTSATAGTAVPGTPLAIGAGGRGALTHTGLSNGSSTYCYAAFVQAGSAYSSAKTVSSRPENMLGATKWIYNTGAASMTAPGVSPVFAVSNDRILHSMTPTGGDWPSTPASWMPFQMNSPSQARPGIPTVDIGGTATKVIYLGSQDGHVYCIDATTGAQIWRTAAPLGNIVQAAVNGAFTTYGSAYNLVFAVTRNSTADNVVYALDAATGAIVWSFNNGGGANGIGIMTGDPWVSYSNNRLYFTSRAKSGGSNGTVWCLSYNGTSASLCSGYPKAAGDIDGGPTLYGSKLYVGTNSGTVLAFDATTGNQLWSYATGDGPVKGFVSADWFNAGGRIYFATTSRLWALQDNGASVTLPANWPVTSITSPSIPLFAGTSLVVGSGDGKLYQINDLNTPSAANTKSVVLGTGNAAVGSPTLDFNNNRLLVGTDGGQVYAVTYPLP